MVVTLSRGRCGGNGLLLSEREEILVLEMCPKHQGLVMDPGEGPNQRQPKPWRRRGAAWPAAGPTGINSHSRSVRLVPSTVRPPNPAQCPPSPPASPAPACAPSSSHVLI